MPTVYTENICKWLLQGCILNDTTWFTNAIDNSKKFPPAIILSDSCPKFHVGTSRPTILFQYFHQVLHCILILLCNIFLLFYTLMFYNLLCPKNILMLLWFQKKLTNSIQFHSVLIFWLRLRLRFTFDLIYCLLPLCYLNYMVIIVKELNFFKNKQGWTHLED